MNILDIVPEEVIYHNILPFFNFHELLRFRRVCRQLKRQVNDFFATKFHHTQELEINQSSKPLSTFLTLGFPASRIYWNNSGSDIFEDDIGIPNFLDLYGESITHLRVHKFFTFLSYQELQFYQRLPNLAHLEFEIIDATARNCFNSPDRQKCLFPPNFRNIITLKIGMVHRSASCDTGYAWDLIDFCKNVEFLSHHLSKDVFEGMAIHPDGAFGCVHPMFKQRFHDPPNETISNLKCYDLENFKNDELYPSSKILMLCDSAFRLGITLMNLDATLFQNVNLSMRNYYRMLSEPVVSLKNLHASVFLMEFSNLEKIKITSTSSCTLSQRSRNSKWPCLQILDVNIDSEWLDEFNGYREETQGLMNIFFFDHVRLNLTDLRLSFTDFVHIHHFTIPCPRSIDLANSCFNLKKLNLASWPGTNKALSELWVGLLQLEEITLERCELLGNVGFVGRERDHPTFLKLTKLKKLTLNYLDEMPKITDTLFKLVLRHMKLTHLYLSSASPLDNITAQGIQSLLTGDFANSIEKFPFRGFALRNTTEDELHNLETKFRSYNMI